MKPSIAKYSFIVLILSVFFISNSFAQNANDALRLAVPGLGSNARALGMGNAYISLIPPVSVY